MSMVSEYNKKKRGVRRIEVERAENGYSVTTHHHQTYLESPGKYNEPTHHVFKSHHEVAKHIKETFGGEGMEGEKE